MKKDISKNICMFPLSVASVSIFVYKYKPSPSNILHSQTFYAKNGRNHLFISLIRKPELLSKFRLMLFFVSNAVNAVWNLTIPIPQ